MSFKKEEKLENLKTKERKYFGKSQEIFPLPNLLEIQIDSYNWLLKEGIKELFEDISPIYDYTGKIFELNFGDYFLDEPKYSEEKAKEKNSTYEAALKVKLELKNLKTNKVKEQEVFLGDIPLMTDRGTFIVNGNERVVVNQLVRSPGAFFISDFAGDRELFKAKIIPKKGAWLEFETSNQDVLWVKIDRKRKIAVTSLLRIFGFHSNEEIKEAFKDVNVNADHDYIKSTLGKDPSTIIDESFVEIYKKIRPGDLATLESAKFLLEGMFFDERKYDLSKVGCYKFNQRLNFDHDKNQRRTLSKEGLVEVVKEIIRLNNGEGKADEIDHLGNRRIKSVGELIQDRFRVGLARLERIIKDRMSIFDPETVTPAQLINARPIVASLHEFFASSQLSHFMDQTNPLSEITNKRRLSALGPGGLVRERAGLEVRDVHRTHYGRICPVETPEGANIGLMTSLACYARVNEYGFIETPYRKVVKEIENNPLKSEGYILRTNINDKNGKTVAKKDETITSQSAKKLSKLDLETLPVKPKVSDEIVYLDALEEEKVIIAEANAPFDQEGYFTEGIAIVRAHGEPSEEKVDNIDFVDISGKQILGVAASLIPFIEHDDAKRALMGANMQRQAVPLVKPDSPIVGTGLEKKIALDSGYLLISEKPGTVNSVWADRIVIKYNDGEEKTHFLKKFNGSNQNTCINQIPLVNPGQKIKKGDILADGASTFNGELALGQNVLVAFMSWGGANFQDAIIISERLVKEDIFTSIHIEEFIVQVRDTKLGPEILTRDIPNVGEEALKDLDEDGIIILGSEVIAGDILVGKISPKGETELSAEEKLLRAIFGEKARDVKDTSLRIPSGEHGKIVGVRILSREKGDDLPTGVMKEVRVDVAQRRKIAVGDKMAGRHGNKGVVAKILPLEDMPYLEDGTPIDVILNPLGVISRLNIGQILETHLGWAAKMQGIKVATPVFEGAKIQDIVEELKKANLSLDGKVRLYDGRTGEQFEEKTTIGWNYLLKLAHLVEDKMHARSTGPYAMITQQPLGGKSQGGGQRFGEMEVWALEGYGAAHTLQEILTLKSDDIIGRTKAYESIMKDEEIKEPRVPESFHVLVKELQSLGLAVDLLKGEKKLKKMDAEKVIEETYQKEMQELKSTKVITAIPPGPVLDLSDLKQKDEFKTLGERKKEGKNE